MALPDHWKITPEISSGVVNSGYLFVNHEANHRGGHLGHALVQCANKDVLAFYSNCSGVRTGGHNGFGWVEYKRSRDGGISWSNPQVMTHTYQAFVDGIVSCQAEKAICTDDGTIVLYYLNNDSKSDFWGPYHEPTAQRSFDHGKTWTEAKTVMESPGRIFDAVYRDGVIYLLFFQNDASRSFFGINPTHVYYLLVSTDYGASYEIRSAVTFDANDRSYGNLVFREDGTLMAYCYNNRDDCHMDYVISEDNGFTWSLPEQSFCKKRIRNPQVAYFDHHYVLHGRSGHRRGNICDFILYVSEDAIHWDDGIVLCSPAPEGNGWQSFYSNNLLVRDKGREKLLIQSSVAYRKGLTNVKQWFIECEE